MDKKNQDLEKAKAVYETSEIITAKVYKISPEQKEELNRLSADRIEKLREGAIPKIRERYEQLVKLRQQQSKVIDGDKSSGD